MKIALVPPFTILLHGAKVESTYAYVLETVRKVHLPFALANIELQAKTGMGISCTPQGHRAKDLGPQQISNGRYLL